MALSIVAAIGAAVIVAPSLHRDQWIARLALRETSEVPPTLLVHGGGDQLVSPVHSRRLAAALTDRGREVTLIEIPMGEHGMDARPGGVGEQIARRAVLDFLDATMK